MCSAEATFGERDFRCALRNGHPGWHHAAGENGVGTLWPNADKLQRLRETALTSFPWRHLATLFGQGLVFEHVDWRGNRFRAEVTGDHDGRPGVTRLDVVPRAGTVLSNRALGFAISDLERAVRDATDGEAARWRSGLPLDWAGVCAHGTVRRSRGRAPVATDPVASVVRDLGGGCTIREVARRMQLERRTANELLRHAETRGQVRCERRNGRASRYWATDDTLPRKEVVRPDRLVASP
jgi:hypothetical protein